MTKELREKATLHYNNFLFFKKETKKIFKNIIKYINNHSIIFPQDIKDNFKLLISKWNNTDNYSGQDYLDMKDISTSINNYIIKQEDSSLKELFMNCLINFDKFQKDLYNFYECAEKIKELEIIKN
jgi:hypothetical protein